jgi:hypothetical protein
MTSRTVQRDGSASAQSDHPTSRSFREQISEPPIVEQFGIDIVADGEIEYPSGVRLAIIYMAAALALIVVGLVSIAISAFIEPCFQKYVRQNT